MLIICWDYDGTLVSSEFVYKNIFMNYLQKIGAVKKNITDEYYFSQYSGKHPINVIKELQKYGYVDTNVNMSVEEWDKVFQDEVKKDDGLILSDNILDILAKITTYSNVFMCIATSTHKKDYETKSACKSVSGLKKYFNIDKNVYMAGDVGNKKLKPDPNVFLYAYKDVLLKNNLKDSDNILVMVEDSKSGCKSASSAKKILLEENPNLKINVIGYLATNKYSSAYALKESGADIIVSKPADLEKLLVKLAEEDKNKASI